MLATSPPANPGTEPPDATRTGGYGLSIKGVCSDGSVDQPGGSAFAGKLNILENTNNPAPSGSLQAALLYVNDTAVESQWGYTQVYNIYNNLFSLFGFFYNGPGNNGMGGIKMPPFGWIPPT